MRNFIFESLIVIFGALPQSEKTLTEPHLNVYRRYICCLIRISLTRGLANNDASKVLSQLMLTLIFSYWWHGLINAFVQPERHAARSL